MYSYVSYTWSRPRPPTDPLVAVYLWCTHQNNGDLQSLSNASAPFDSLDNFGRSIHLVNVKLCGVFHNVQTRCLYESCFKLELSSWIQKQSCCKIPILKLRNWPQIWLCRCLKRYPVPIKSWLPNENCAIAEVRLLGRGVRQLLAMLVHAAQMSGGTIGVDRVVHGTVVALGCSTRAALMERSGRFLSFQINKIIKNLTYHVAEIHLDYDPVRKPEIHHFRRLPKKVGKFPDMQGLGP